MRSKEAGTVNRRAFMLGSALFAAEGLALYKIPKLRRAAVAGLAEGVSPVTGAVTVWDQESSEVGKTPSVIRPVQGEKLLPTTKSIVLDLPGQNYKQDNNLDVLTSLSRLGVRVKAELGNNGNYLDDLVKEIYRIQDQTNLKTMSWVIDSDSWPVAAQIIPRISDRVDSEYVILMSTPESFDDVKGAAGIAGKAVAASGYGPSTILNGAVDEEQFHNPLAQFTIPQAASANLADYQDEEEAKSETITRKFAKWLRRHKDTKVLYARLQNPEDDTLVDEPKSIKDFRKKGIPIREVIVGGLHQAHDNPTVNKDAYNAAFDEYFKTLDRRSFFRLRR